MFVSLLPFSTAFLSAHISFKLSIGIYWLNILALGLLLYINWSYAEQNDFLTIKGEEKETISKIFKRRIIYAQAMYATGALLCFINNYLSIIVIVLIQLNYALALFFGHIKKNHK